MKVIKITVLVLILIFGFLIPYVYSTISGNYAVSFTDPSSPLKYYTMIGDTTNGLWVNVKTGTLTAVTSITNPVTVAQATGTNLHMVLDSGTLTSITNAVNVNATQTTNPWVIGSNKSNNAAVPGATNLGVLPGISNANSPTYVEGDQVLLSQNLSGAIRVTGSTNAGLNVIDLDHMMIHLGLHYRSIDQQTIASAGVFDYLLITPNTSTQIHFDYHIETDTEMTIGLYELPTYGSTGSSLTAFNNNRNSGNTTTLTLFTAPSITTTGTLLTKDLSGSSSGGGRTGNFIESGDEFILKQNTPYLLRITNLAAGNGISILDIGWYEFVLVP